MSNNVSIALSSAASSLSGDVEEANSHNFVPVGPLRIHTFNNNELMTRLVGHMLCGATKTYQVVTANAQFYNLAEQREDFRNCIANAEYVCADGISIVMACRWLASSTVSRVPGVDLVEGLCAEATKYNSPVYFLGGKAGSIQRSAEELAKKYPGFRLAGFSCPPLNFETDPFQLQAVLEDIQRVDPAVIFVALGAPRQELFIHNHIRALGTPVAVGVGGSFEIIGGVVQRAPALMQKLGLEWLFRWFQEPQRLAGRYLVGNTVFLYYVFSRMLTRRRHD
jgi:N-acetylglucosaminyldiphosphoundecaprenol N-acetyl-beta-D-mannosaminyltransferase